MADSRVWISSLILLIIGLHAVPVLYYQGHRQTGWPILTWAMYARSLPPGPIETTKRRIVGSTSTGESEILTPHLVGMSTTALRKNYLQPMWLGDSAAARELLRRLNRDRETPFIEVRVEGERFILVADSVVVEALPVVSYKVDPSDSR